ncbi:MAG: cytochrome b N-terminal domain-containing protein [Deltaproteobacteria bacterium]|nr:cytochrome b N-terminal domain-containing protein [Deltaproteobacteria bacterium]
MVKSKALDFTLTFGLGGMAFILILLLFGTGILLKFYYLPFPDRAHDSILYLNNNVLFGPFIRNIHYWSANILIIVAFLHFMRVFFTSAFHSPRQLNWIIGIGLFIIILLFNFTGYLLPWDQLSFWAVTICTGMMEYIPWAGLWVQSLIRGGTEVGPSTLSNFYAAHTIVLPVFMILLVPFHFWRIRKAGGIVIPDNSDTDSRVPVIPDLILREIVTALVLVAVILVLSVMFDAPLGESANSGLSPNPTKAPWYFMGLQEMLLHMHPFFAVCVIPLLILAGLIKTAYGIHGSGTEGIWFISSRGRLTSLISFSGALLLTIIVIILDEYLIDFTLLIPGVPQIISNGLMPCILIFLIYSVFYRIFLKRFLPDKNEKYQAVFVFFLSVFIVLTVTGIWFRGEGMKLVW